MCFRGVVKQNKHSFCHYHLFLCLHSWMFCCTCECSYVYRSVYSFVCEVCSYVFVTYVYVCAVCSYFCVTVCSYVRITFLMCI